MANAELFTDPHFASTAEDFQVGDVNSVSSRNVFHQRSVSTKFHDFFNLLQSEFRAGSTSRVFGWCDRLKMVGIHTAPYAAEMVEIQSFWNWAYQKLVVVPVRVSIWIASIAKPMRHESVASSLDMPPPNPAWRFIPTVFKDKGDNGFSVVPRATGARFAFYATVAFVVGFDDLCLTSAAALAIAVTHFDTFHSSSIARSVA